MVMGRVHQGIVPGRLAYTSYTCGRGRMQWRWVGGTTGCGTVHGDGVGAAVGWRVREDVTCKPRLARGPLLSHFGNGDADAKRVRFTLHSARAAPLQPLF
jgi:hypothetical protein